MSEYMDDEAGIDDDGIGTDADTFGRDDDDDDDDDEDEEDDDEDEEDDDDDPDMGDTDDQTYLDRLWYAYRVYQGEEKGEEAGEGDLERFVNDVTSVCHKVLGEDAGERKVKNVMEHLDDYRELHNLGLAELTDIYVDGMRGEAVAELDDLMLGKIRPILEPDTNAMGTGTTTALHLFDRMCVRVRKLRTWVHQTTRMDDGTEATELNVDPKDQKPVHALFDSLTRSAYDEGLRVRKGRASGELVQMMQMTKTPSGHPTCAWMPFAGILEYIDMRITRARDPDAWTILTQNYRKFKADLAALMSGPPETRCPPVKPDHTKYSIGKDDLGGVLSFPETVVLQGTGCTTYADVRPTFKAYRDLSHAETSNIQCVRILDDDQFCWSDIEDAVNDPILDGDDFAAACRHVMENIPTPNFDSIMRYQWNYRRCREDDEGNKIPKRWPDGTPLVKRRTNAEGKEVAPGEENEEDILEFEYETETVPDWETMRSLYFMFGRMFHPVKSVDNFQVAAFFHGKPGTGKSTLINYLVRMMGAYRGGVVDSNMEDKFGWQELYDKDYLVCHELTRQCAIGQGDFNATVSGDERSISVKNQGAVHTVVRGHLMMAGNHKPHILKDPASLRRLVTFEFQKRISNPSADLDARLMGEQGNVLVKSQIIYALVVKFFRHKTIWSNYEAADGCCAPILGDTLRRWYDKLRQDIDLVDNFIESSGIFTCHHAGHERTFTRCSNPRCTICPHLPYHGNNDDDDDDDDDDHGNNNLDPSLKETLQTLQEHMDAGRCKSQSQMSLDDQVNVVTEALREMGHLTEAIDFDRKKPWYIPETVLKNELLVYIKNRDKNLYRTYTWDAGEFRSKMRARGCYGESRREMWNGVRKRDYYYYNCVLVTPESDAVGR